MSDTAENPMPILEDVMIDLETLGTDSNAAILSIGAVFFNPKTGIMGRRYHQRVEFNSAINGGNVSTDTIKWWISQSAEAGADVVSGTLTLQEVLAEFADWLGTGNVKPWGNGATFDVVILENAFRRQKMHVPWGFWNVRDCRTVEDLATDIDSRENYERRGVHHNALDDAVYQAEYISGMVKNLRAAKIMNDAARIDPELHAQKRAV